MDSKISSFITSQGLTVIHSFRPHSMNLACSLRVIAGSMYENPEEAGVAHFLEHMVLDGTEKYTTKKELSGLIESKGGFRNASTNKEGIEYQIMVLKEEAKAAFEYLSQIILYPLFSEDTIEKQKKIIEQEILRFKSNPEEFASRLAYSTLFKSRLGGLNTGDIDAIRKITKNKLESFYARTHCAQNMVLALCGNITLDEAKSLAEHYFTELKPGSKIPLVEILPIQQKQAVYEVLPESKQSVLVLAYRGYASSDPDRYAALLLFQILLKGSTSRLNQEIREKRALAYSVNGMITSGRNLGLFLMRVGLAEKNVPLCLEVIQAELKKVSEQLLSQDEINKSLAQIKASLSFSFENSLTEAAYYANGWCSTGKIKEIHSELEQYSLAADPVIIRDTAVKLFSQTPGILILGSKIPKKET